MPKAARVRSPTALPAEVAATFETDDAGSRVADMLETDQHAWVRWNTVRASAVTMTLESDTFDVETKRGRSTVAEMLMTDLNEPVRSHAGRPLAVVPAMLETDDSSQPATELH